TLVKDESLFDRYDRAFAAFYGQVAALYPEGRDIPLEWLVKEFQKKLTPEEKAALEKHGWDKLMEMFRERLQEQKGRHAGGSKWIGTDGSSPFGQCGSNPEGRRIGGPSAGRRTGFKGWERREFRDDADQQELGTRDLRVALRRLRRFARDGAETEPDVVDTIA